METESGGRQKITDRLNLDMLKDPRNLAIASFSLGMIIGLIVLGWWLIPVNWTDASAAQLRTDLQTDYLRMAIDSYSQNGDQSLAGQRITELGDGAAVSLSEIAAAPGDQSGESIQYFQSQLGIEPITETNNVEQDLIASNNVDEEGGLFGTQSLLLTMCSITGILGLALGGLYLFRRKQSGSGKRSAALKAQDITKGAQSSVIEALGDSPPISQWMTTYLMGDDLFDDSFSIDSSNGEFLGECGVGIAETIGVGDPKRVSAFELWLFDKNDIQTVTKVLMSNHIFSEDSSRERLAAKGEPILASSGTEVVLETETLQLVVRVVDMEYGGGPMPEESYFDRVTLELAVWSKQ